MAPKKAGSKKTPAKKVSAKREREVIAIDSDEEETPQPQPKKPKKSSSTISPKLSTLDALFKHYVEATQENGMDVEGAETNCIGPGGIQKMCEEVEIEMDDVSLLIMAWHMGASKVGYFSREEWMKLTNFGVKDLDSLKARIRNFHKDIENMDNAKRLFLFTFNYIKENPESKVIPIEVAEGYIRLILPKNIHTEPFCDFLNKQKDEPKGYRAMNLDQWKMWFEFSQTVPIDLSTYDEEAAWPLIIDNYVVQRRAFLSTNGMQTSTQ